MDVLSELCSMYSATLHTVQLYVQCPPPLHHEALAWVASAILAYSGLALICFYRPCSLLILFCLSPSWLAVTILSGMMVLAKRLDTVQLIADH